jgi:cerevisin
MRYIAATLLTITLTYASPLTARVDSDLAPLSTTGDHIQDAYIVRFKKGVDVNQIALHLSGVEELHGSDVSAYPDSLLLPSGVQIVMSGGVIFPLQ